MVLQYSTQSAFVATAMHWAYTVVPYVVGRKEFWVFMLLHLGVGYLYRTGSLKAADNAQSPLYIDWSDMHVISAITTFFEVFYTNQTFGRYLHLHSTTRKLLGLVSEFCFEATLHIKSSAQQHTRLGARFFLCGVVLFFLELKEDNGDEELENLKVQGLITDAELRYLKETFVKQSRSLVMLHWASKIARDGHKIASDNKKAPANALKIMVDKLVGARTCMQEIVDTLSLPIPFQYFHLLNIMLVVNLCLWAYGMGVTDSMWAPVVYFFASLIFMGMMELASQLSDPFGDDDTDFPLTKWIADTMEDAAVILEYEYFESGWDPILRTEEPLRKNDAIRFPHQSDPSKAAE